jgi:hypothetical protein
MAITINGTGSITGLTAGGLPDGSITSADLASGAITAGALPTGSILQVVTTTKTDTFSESISSGGLSANAISCAITPSATSSKILLIAQLSLSGSNANKVTAALYKDGVRLDAYTGDAADSRTRTSVASSIANTWRTTQASPVYLDSPSSTSEITYSFRLSQGSGTTNTVYLNRSGEDENQNYQYRSASTIVLLEVAG